MLIFLFSYIVLLLLLRMKIFIIIQIWHCNRFKQTIMLRSPNSNYNTYNQIFIRVVLLALLCTGSVTRVVYPQGLWAMNSFGEFTAQNQEIMTYFDFNRDRFVDILTRVSSGSAYILKLYLWDEQTRAFVSTAKVEMEMFKPITVMAVDIAKDAGMELIVTVQLGQQSDISYKILIYSLTCSDTATQCVVESIQDMPLIESKSIPTVFQIQGQNILLHTNNDNQLKARVYQNSQLESKDFVSQYFNDASNDASDQVKERVCTNYNEIFYLDYNGDCVQDMIIYCRPEAGMADLQFYRGDEKSKFRPQFRTSVNSPMKLLSVAIADINFDGLVDIILLVNSPSGELYLQIHYNTAIKQKYIRCRITIQAQTKNYFPFHFINSESELNQDGVLQIQRFYLNFTYAQWSIDTLQYSNFYLRVGDINNDGYLDLLIDGPNRVELLINEQCLDQFCGSYNPKFMEKWVLGRIRVFNARKIDGLATYNGKLCKISFFDLHQDGRLDLIANLCPIDSFAKQNAGKLLAIYNALPMDAFFLKINILQNLQNQVIKSGKIDRKLNVYGAHADFYVSALTGQRIPACGNQLSHPGRSLQLPYIHTGLGRTNNYVQELTVSISGKQSVLIQTWSPIVPNSQLIVVPGPKWLLQTYISPTAVMSILFWFVVLILILIGIWIVRLTRQQKIEDKENQDSFYSILR